MFVKLKSRLVKVIIGVIFCSVSVFAIWLIFFSRMFIIEYVDVESEKIDPTLARTLLFRYMDEHQGLFDQHNILFFRPLPFRQYLSQFAVIDDFTLTKRYPKSLHMTLVGSPFHVIGYWEGHFYELSPSGSIVREVDPAPFSAYSTLISKALTGQRTAILKDSLKAIDTSFPVVLLSSPQQADQDANNLNENILTHIETMKRLLRDEKYVILFFRIDPSGHQYRAFTHEGWNILFSDLSDATQQATNLKTLLQTTIKKKRKLLDYVDVRFENRLFYSLRN